MDKSWGEDNFIFFKEIDYGGNYYVNIHLIISSRRRPPAGAFSEQLDDFPNSQSVEPII